MTEGTSEPTQDSVESTSDVEATDVETTDGVEVIDITENLTDAQIQGLFDAFKDEDWQEVDRLLDEFERTGVYSDVKAGGADRNRGQAEKLRKYWTVGAGAAKIRWGTHGDWTRCVEHLTKYLGPRAKGYCSLRHKEMNGYYPGSKLNKADGVAPVMEHKVVGLKGMNVVSADEGIVETIISVTGIVDNVKDRIMPGAYSKTLAKRKPKGVWSHDWDTPVSKTLDVKELMPGDAELPATMPNGDPWPAGAGALKVKTQFNLDTQRGREAYSDVVFFADEQEWSIGYNVPVGGAKVDQKSGVREIETLELYEYSPVLFGAMPLARTTSVKEAQMAFKALKGGAASWLADATESVDEFAPAGPDEEEKDAAIDYEDYAMDAEQMILVKRAISTLSDLLAVVQGTEVKMGGPEDDNEQENSSTDMAEDAAEGEDPAADAAEDMTEYDSLASAIEDMVNDAKMRDSLVAAAQPVDEAINNEDVAAMDDAANAFLDLVEQGITKGVDAETLKEVAAMLADLIDSVVPVEPAPEGKAMNAGKVCANCGKPVEKCDCGDTVPVENKACASCGKMPGECKCGDKNPMYSKNLINLDELQALTEATK